MSTEDDDDDEEADLLNELLCSDRLSRQQSDRVITRLTAIKQSKKESIARTLFETNGQPNQPDIEEKVESISPPLDKASTNRSSVAAASSNSSPKPTPRNSSGAATHM